MKKVAILNFKGGTGKTTTAVNLSHALALRRQSVLVVDCDPQGSIADWLGVNPKNTFFDLLSDTVKFRKMYIPSPGKIKCCSERQKIGLG